MQNTDDVIEIDLKEIFGVLWNKAWLILLCGIIAGTIGFCYSHFLITPQYQSTTKVYILSKQNEGNVTYTDLQMGTQLTKDSVTENDYDRKELYRVLNSLPDNYKAPFSMFVSGFKYREIADKLSLPLGTVKSRIFLTRHSLQEQLKDFLL